MPDHESDHTPEHANRVERLEEAALFTERTVEQLSEEVRALGARLLAAERRIAEFTELLGGLTGRITELESSADGEPTPDDPSHTRAVRDDELRDQRPPHNSGRAHGY